MNSTSHELGSGASEGVPGFGFAGSRYGDRSIRLVSRACHDPITATAMTTTSRIRMPSHLGKLRRSQSRKLQLSADVAEPLDDLVVQRNAVGAAFLLLLVFGQSWVHDTVVARSGRSLPERPEHVVHVVLELVEVAEGLDVVRREVVVASTALLV